MNLAPLSTILAPRVDHDRATIGSRSGFDRGPKSSPIACRSVEDDFAPFSPRSRFDRAAIAARSRRDRGSIAPRSWSSSTTFSRRPIPISLDGRSRLSDPVRRDRDVNQPSDDASLPPAVRSRSSLDEDQPSDDASLPPAVRLRSSLDEDQPSDRLMRVFC